MIHVTRGLPGSGKSTWAMNWVSGDPENRVRVNRDDIRLMLFGRVAGVDEALVTKVEEQAVRDALAAGKEVVVDACHLKSAYVRKWLKFGDVTTVDFVMPVELAVGSDRVRGEIGGRTVGEDVIRGMAKRYHIPEDGTLPKVDLSGLSPFEHKPYVRGTIPTYSFDIDGTLALHEGVRDPHDTSRYHLDRPNIPVLGVLFSLQEANPTHYIIGMSGRSEDFRAETSDWLARNGVYLDALFMRPSGDTRNDAIVKSEMVDEHVSNVYDVTAHFDDRQRVVDALRAKGMTVFQVAEGNF